MTPMVSILMNCYNGEEYLKTALESVFDQTYKDYEIIFWDNASNDSTEEIVKSYDDKRVKYYKAEINEPLGKARNIAVKKCTGKYIAILDADDYWERTKLQKQVEYFEQNQGAVVCYTDTKYVYGKKESGRKLSDSVILYSGDVYKNLLKQSFVICSTIMLNVSLMEGELYFNEHLKYSEEYDLLLRCAKLGEFIVVNEPLVYYRVHKNALTRNVDQIIKEEDEFIFKYYDDLHKYGIDITDMKRKRYRALVTDLLHHGNKRKANDLLPNLLKYPDLKNILIYLLVRLKLGSFLNPIFSNKISSLFRIKKTDLYDFKK